MGTVWAVSKTRERDKHHGRHVAQKPTSLLSRIILASSNKGDAVLDPFTGSGSTGVVAAKFGRPFVGIEQNREYLDIAVRRFKHLKASGPSGRVSSRQP